MKRIFLPLSKKEQALFSIIRESVSEYRVHTLRVQYWYCEQYISLKNKL